MIRGFFGILTVNLLSVEQGFGENYSHFFAEARCRDVPALFDCPFIFSRNPNPKCWGADCPDTAYTHVL